MKTFMFTIVVLCVFTATTHAQISEIKYGAKAGINLTDLTSASGKNSSVSVAGIGGASVNNSFKLGLNISAFAEICINKQFSVQPEIQYSSQGIRSVSKLNINTSGFVINTRSTDLLNLDYINIPIVAKYYINKKFNVQAGPQIGFLLNESLKRINNNGTVTVNLKPKDGKSNSYFNTVDFGLALGLGYELSTGVFFDARYYFGLIGILKDQYNTNNISYKNQVLQVSVGYKF